MKIVDDEIIFSSGKRQYVNNGIIGISPELDIFQGYDGGFYPELDAEERRELADYMIAKWTDYRNV